MTEKSFKRFLVSVFCFCLAVLMAIVSPIALAAEGEGNSETAAASENNPSEEEYRNQISDLQDEQIKIQQEMKDYNKQEFTGTREDVIAMGYEPCGKCHP